MPITAEGRARQTIDRLLTDAGWLIQSRDETNINAAAALPSANSPSNPATAKPTICSTFQGKISGE